jgi:hypothetical protein
MRTVIDDILAQFPETDVKLAWNVPHIYRGNDDVFGMSAPKNRLFLDPRSDQVLYELRPRLEPSYVVLQSIFQVPSIGRSIRSCWEIWFARLAELDASRQRRSVVLTGTSQTQSSTSALVGSWRLISFELRDDDGTVSRPWGDDVTGMNTYTADGYLSEQFSSAHRPALTHDDWVSAPPGEIDLAARHYFAYAGTYELDGRTVTYHLDESLMPNWIGKTEQRFWSVTGDMLTITTPPLLVGGKMQVSTLVWRRAAHHRPDVA